MIRILQRLLVLFVLVSIAVSASQAQPAAMHVQKGEESKLAIFKQYWAKFKTTSDRVEAVMELAGVEDSGVLDVLLPKSKEKDVEPEVVRAIVKVFASFKNPAQIDGLIAALKAEKSEPGRVLLLRAVADGKFKDAVAVVAPSLTDKTSWEVRRYALKALIAVGDASLAPTVLAACDDSEAAVRGEAVETLTAWKSELVVPKAIKLLDDSVWQVRTVAIAALAKIRSADSIDPLIARLSKEEGRLVPDIAEALAGLTAQEFGAKPDKWNEWWSKQDKANFVLPKPEAIAYLRGKHEAITGPGKGAYHKSGDLTKFNGIETPSRSIVFIIDVSGSMEALVIEKERFQGMGYPSLSRIDIVKTELQRTIDHLDANVKFNILAFATDVRPWKEKLQAASILTKAQAKEWVSHLEPLGGSSKEDLAMVGLSSTAGLEKGKTNTYGALTLAMGIDKVHTGDTAYKCEVDTIFFLSDGRPTVGVFVDPEDIRREIKALNELRKIVIHTIAIGEFQKDFMKGLAEENGGVFVDLGK